MRLDIFKSAKRNTVITGIYISYWNITRFLGVKFETEEKIQTACSETLC
jgi:hypothetical protein